MRGRTVPDGGATQEWIDNTNKTTPADLTYTVTLTSSDLGSYDFVEIFVAIVSNTANAVDFSPLCATCYYD